MAVASRTAVNVGVHVFLLNDDFLRILAQVWGCAILGWALLRDFFFFFLTGGGCAFWWLLSMSISTEHGAGLPAFIVCRLVRMASLTGGL